MTLFRRFLVLQALMLWQGGFFFYASFVVPVGTDVLGGSFEQGRITRFVTQSINWIGLAAILIFAWDLLSTPPRSSKLKWVLWGSWLVMAAGLAALFLLHPRLMELVDFETMSYHDRKQFRFYHRTYLWVSTFQWAAGLVYAFTIVWAWKRVDRT